MSYIKIGSFSIGNGTDILLTDIENSSSGDTNKRTITHTGFDGVEYDDITLQPRYITVKGCIFATSIDELNQLKQDLIGACNPLKEAEIFYNNGTREYYAKAYPSLPTFAKINRLSSQFLINLELSKFWWLSSAEIVTGMFKIENNLYGTFTLPRAFTKRTQGAHCTNEGDIDILPVFEISVATAFTSDLIIKNATYNKQIKLVDYNGTVGDLIRVDCENCTITSSKNGNIISYLSNDSEFFSIKVGYNKLTFDKTGTTAVVKYRERFLGV